MNGEFLLDTNIVIALFAEDENVSQNFAAADEILIPVIVVGELLHGARKSGRIKANLHRAEDFAETNGVLNCDIETAKHYAQIKNDLRLKGKPIPENDIWIAALALQHDLILVTRDAHFGEVDGLTYALCLIRLNRFKIMLTEAQRGFQHGFFLTEQELRRIFDSLIEQMKRANGDAEPLA